MLQSRSVLHAVKRTSAADPYSRVMVVYQFFPKIYIVHIVDSVDMHIFCNILFCHLYLKTGSIHTISIIIIIIAIMFFITVSITKIFIIIILLVLPLFQLPWAFFYYNTNIMDAIVIIITYQ